MYSLSAQCIGARARLVERNPVARYVNGSARYTYLQKCGIADGGTSNPQNQEQMKTRKVEAEEAISMLSRPEISMCPNMLAQMKVTQISRKMRVLRECIESVTSAFR